MTEHMNITDLKIWGLSSFAITMNLMNVDTALSLTLTCIAIGYTVHKWILMHKRNKKK
tara:strand:- start:1101 stop:1274 length:174 start_codon:yes stop_codon:yes gene_type:complete